MANWQAFKLQVPGKNLLEKVRGVLETLLVFMEVLKTILQTIKAFLIDFGNPIRLLVEALVKLITDLFESLKRSGLYGYYDVPNPLRDPSFKSHFGGYQAFLGRWKASLLDTRDMNRPQPVKGALQGGFVMLVVDADGPVQLIRLIMALLEFFGQEFRFPRYLPPANFKVMPLGSSGDPILSVTKLFSDPPKAIELSWSLGSQTGSPDPSFTGMAANLANEFNPPNWLIERAEVSPTQEITVEYDQDSAQLRDPTLAGPVTTNVEMKFVNPRNLAKKIKRKQPVIDEFGDPVIKFQTAYILGKGSASFILGQLGTYRFIDTGVEYDKVYYYRIRAFSGPLDVTAAGVLNYKGPLQQNKNRGDQLYLPWPSKDPKSRVVIGKPSNTARIRFVKVPDKFDVLENLRALFLTAFSLNFGQPYPASYNKDNPLHIGEGVLVEMSGAIIGKSMLPLISENTPAKDFAPSPNTGRYPDQPWQDKVVRFQVARLVTQYATVLMEGGSAIVEGFRKIMQGPLPKGPVKTKWPAVGSPTSLEKLVIAFTRVDPDPDLGAAGSVASAILEINPTGTVPLDTVRAYGSAFGEAAVRENVLVAINYVKALGSHGVPPDWVRFSILRDMIPWSGQFLYDIVAKIQALLDAFNGVIAEIKKFIDLLIRKIDAMEQFIKYLVSLMNFILKLEIGCYVLYVPTVPGGDVSDWFAAVDGAGGTKPTSGVDGYTAGICLAYMLPDVSSFTKAFGLIF